MRYGALKQLPIRDESDSDPLHQGGCNEGSWMKSMLKKISAILLLSVSLTTAIAAPIDDAITLFDRQDYLRALEGLRPLGQAGDPVAQYYLGLIFEKGLGVPANPSIAIQWYERGAEQGHADSQNNLGVIYLNGPASLRQSEKAKSWLQQAAEQGHLIAQMNLAYAYLNAVGFAKNDALALKWYGEAARRDHAAAINMLGVMHERGQGVPASMSDALKWYEAATKRGLPAAMYNLGLAHAMARSVPQDYAKAYFWFKLAQQAGLEEAGDAAMFVGGYLNEKQKNILDSRVETCRIQHGFQNCEIN